MRLLMIRPPCGGSIRLPLRTRPATSIGLLTSPGANNIGSKCHAVVTRLQREGRNFRRHGPPETAAQYATTSPTVGSSFPVKEGARPEGDPPDRAAFMMNPYFLALT